MRGDDELGWERPHAPKAQTAHELVDGLFGQVETLEVEKGQPGRMRDPLPEAIAQ